MEINKLHSLSVNYAMIIKLQINNTTNLCYTKLVSITCHIGISGLGVNKFFKFYKWFINN